MDMEWSKNLHRIAGKVKNNFQNGTTTNMNTGENFITIGGHKRENSTTHYIYNKLNE